jgi:hypothetical protein
LYTVVAAIVAAADARIPTVLNGFETRLIDDSFFIETSESL